MALIVFECVGCLVGWLWHNSRRMQQRRLVYLARLVDFHAGYGMDANDVYGSGAFNVAQLMRFKADFFIR